MKVCVAGMWHLGSVTAACLASMGHEVLGYDSDEYTISELRAHRPPVFEPGLSELIGHQIANGRLSFSSDLRTALQGADVAWITYDTPVDDDDVADVDGVLAKVAALVPRLEADAVVLISSQLIAGCTRILQDRCAREYPAKRVGFAYSPENLRLGNAIAVFSDPDRVVVGVNDERVRGVVKELLHPFADRILWMSIESAEMTKHALNTFLAMCVSFANELAAICEQVGADAKEVERGLKSEKRIGPRAYLAPGEAFAGGTLARDVNYLRVLAQESGQSSLLFTAIKESNDRHREWARRKLTDRFPSLEGVRVAVLGLTYKPGTDTLRRSSAVELCRWLAQRGAVVVAHDPRVRTLPTELSEAIQLAGSVAEALRDAEVVVIATPWSEYKALSVEALSAAAKHPVVIDANRIASGALDVPGVEYFAVGTAPRRAT